MLDIFVNTSLVTVCFWELYLFKKISYLFVYDDLITFYAIKT